MDWATFLLILFIIIFLIALIVLWFIPYTPKSIDETFYYPYMNDANPNVRGWVRVAYSSQRPDNDFPTQTNIKVEIIDPQILDTTIDNNSLYTQAKAITETIYDTYTKKDNQFIGVSVQLVLDSDDANTAETTAQTSRGYVAALKYSPTEGKVV